MGGCGQVSGGKSVTVTIGTPVSDVRFQDANLQKCFNEQVVQKGWVNADDVEVLECIGAGISNASGLYQLSSLKHLHLGFNRLNSIDLRSNTELRTLNLDFNWISYLDLSRNTLLEEMYLYDNALPSIDLSANTALRVIGLTENYITDIDLRANSALEVLYIEFNPLSARTISYLNSLNSETVTIYQN